jgi:amino acid permease
MFAFLDIFTETFDPMVLLYPYIFQQIGFVYATHVLLIATFFLGLSCKLLIESTRL